MKIYMKVDISTTFYPTFCSNLPSASRQLDLSKFFKGSFVKLLFNYHPIIYLMGELAYIEKRAKTP